MNDQDKNKEELIKELQDLEQKYNSLKSSYEKDITERKKAEQTMRESNEILRATERLSHIGSWKWVVETNAVQWSGELCRINGYDPKLPVPGFAEMSSFYTTESWERLNKAVTKALQNGESYELELDVVRTDGMTRKTFAKGEVDYDSSGRIVSLHGTVQDITERKQAEEEISRMAQMLSVAPNSITIHDFNGNFIYANQKTFDMHGYTREEFLALPLDKLDTPDSVKMIPARMKEINEKGKATFNVEHFKKDGSILPMEVFVCITKWGDDNVLLSISFDITERKQAEEALMKSEQRYRDLFNQANEGLLIMTPEGQFSDLNQAFAEMHGYTVDELKNYDIRKLDVLGDKTLEDRNNIVGRILAGEVVRFEVEHYHKDGHIFPLSVTANLVRIGEQQFFVAFHQDITERKQAEQTLQKLNLAINNSKEVVLMTDKEGIITYVNPEFTKMYGFTAEEVVGKVTPRILNSGLYSKEHAEKLWNILINKQSVPATQFQNKCKDGKLIDVEGSADPILDHNGEIIGFIGIQRDITERKKAEQEIKLKNEELLLLNASKDKFFSIISHDLKSPLTGLLGLSKSMVKNINDFSKEELNDFSKRLYETVDNLYKMIEDLLEWARIQKGLITCSFESFNLNTLVKENVEIIAERANQKQISIRNNLPVSLNVLADLNMTYTILRNLISNAVKFTHRGGYVEIGSSSHKSFDDYIEIFVKDSGVGISETNIDKIFKIDGKIQTSGTENEPSTGLGLILCKEFIEMQGGEIRVESEVGKGSTFYFTLPL